MSDIDTIIGGVLMCWGLGTDPRYMTVFMVSVAQRMLLSNDAIVIHALIREPYARPFTLLPFPAV